MRLLLVEDNPKLSQLLEKLLREHAFAVDVAATADTATEALAVASYDLVILDLTLPDGDGDSILRRMRQDGLAVPVLVITARGDIVERVRLLDHGADDYLVKPFSPDEFLARVRALLRRPPHTLAPILRAGNLTLDPAQLEVRVNEAPVDMPRREMALLEALLRQFGKVVTRTRLDETSHGFGNETTPNATEAAISRLRRRLEQHGASVAVVTMRGLGYILADRPPDGTLPP